MKYLSVIALLCLAVTVSPEVKKENIAAAKNTVQQQPTRKNIDRATDSIRVIIHKNAAIANVQSDIIIDEAKELRAELDKWKWKYNNRPVKIIYRAAEIPDCIPDTVIKYKKVTRKELRIINKNKQKNNR